MPTLLQINSVVNWGSTGRIAEDIGNTVIKLGWKSYIAYGRHANQSKSIAIKIGNQIDLYQHVIKTRILDKHGLGSKNATKKFIQEIDHIKPDIIHLHNIHGYYINYKILFEYIKDNNIPVIWTLHDCWPITGHCSHFAFINCNRWKTGCYNCPQKREYPQSLFFDRSISNYNNKKKYFASIENLTLVPVSKWLQNFLKESFLSKYPSICIHNGIDTDQFNIQRHTEQIKKRYNITENKIILGVASIWSKRKGLDDFIQLRNILESDYAIVLVGVSHKQIKDLPSNIYCIPRTNNITELAMLYSAASVFVNPTWEDNFPTTNLESLSCGTPVITYRTGGSIEAISKGTGIIIDQGDIEGLKKAIKTICSQNKSCYTQICRNRAINLYNKKEQYKKYIELYNTILLNKSQNVSI